MSSTDSTAAPAAASPAPAVPRWAWHRRLYDWVLSWADTPYGLPALVVMAFIESSIFPIPPDVLLIPLVLGAATRWWRYALWCTLASVLGGMLGYGIGPSWWGQGLGTEVAQVAVACAFERYEAAVVWASTDADNVASCRVLEKVGMRRDGVLRQRRAHNNQRSDEAHSSILRREWVPAAEPQR
jgi:ribosomal protein S18 acetylase RimI-like enzyme